MKVLVIGAEGQLGVDVCAAFAEDELTRADLDGDGMILDICDGDAVRRIIADEVRPELAINTAAAHNVPQCEDDAGLAFAVNAIGARNLALACHSAGTRLLHVSTDYVFGYGGTRPFVETDLPMPLSVYAASKLAGEHLIAVECPDHVIVRTAAMYGTAPCRAKGGRNFVDMMLHLAASQSEVKVVTDEITTPTHTVALAKQLRVLAEKGEPGVYHATCTGECSWFDFAKAVFEETDTEANLVEATATELQASVRRPNYSVLENRYAREQGLDIMPHWRDALKGYLAARHAS